MKSCENCRNYEEKNKGLTALTDMPDKYLKMTLGEIIEEHANIPGFRAYVEIFDRILSAKKKGNILDIVGPLGSGFKAAPPASAAILVAGGHGSLHRGPRLLLQLHQSISVILGRRHLVELAQILQLLAELAPRHNGLAQLAGLARYILGLLAIAPEIGAPHALLKGRQP